MWYSDYYKVLEDLVVTGNEKVPRTLALGKVVSRTCFLRYSAAKKVVSRTLLFFFFFF